MLNFNSTLTTWRQLKWTKSGLYLKSDNVDCHFISWEEKCSMAIRLRSLQVEKQDASPFQFKPRPTLLRPECSRGKAIHSHLFSPNSSTVSRITRRQLWVWCLVSDTQKSTVGRGSISGGRVVGGCEGVKGGTWVFLGRWMLELDSVDSFLAKTIMEMPLNVHKQSLVSSPCKKIALV